jgi:hypothetical protein
MTRLALLVFSSLAVLNSARATDKCQAISDIAGQTAIAKPAAVAQLKKNPQKGTLGEAWRLLWFIHYQDLETLGVPERDQQEIFKTIVALNFSNNPEVNYDIFREYFYLKCKRKERGLSSVSLSSIPAASLTGCWNSVANRSQFQVCVEKLMAPEKEKGTKKSSSMR